MSKGTALIQLGQIEEAITSFKHALEYDSDCDLCLYNLAILYANILQIDVSLDYLTKAVDLNSEWRRKALKEEKFSPLRGGRTFESLTN